MDKTPDIVDWLKEYADATCVAQDDERLREAATTIEVLRAEVSMLSREVSREASLRHTLADILGRHNFFLDENRVADNKARAATDKAMGGGG